LAKFFFLTPLMVCHISRQQQQQQQQQYQQQQQQQQQAMQVIFSCTNFGRLFSLSERKCMLEK